MALRKRILTLTALVCLLTLLASTAAAWTPRYPDQKGAATDNAAVLSQETISDIADFSQRLEEETGLNLCVVTVDFLDGVSLGNYCAGLREMWNLSEDTALLLLAVGEDSFYLDGDMLPLSAQVRSKLLSAYLEEPFLAQDYDGALRSFIPALSQEIGKALDTAIGLEGLFGQATANSAASVEEWAEGWEQRWLEDTAQVSYTPVERLTYEDERSGFSLGKVILTVMLLMVIFGNSGRARRMGRADGCGCSGCGCAPFSSLLAGLGLWQLWGRPAPRGPRGHHHR